MGSHAGPSDAPVAVEDPAYLAAGGITAPDAETGTERWQAQTDNSAQGIAVADRVYVGAGSNGTGSVAAFTRDGDIWWQTHDIGPVYATPDVADEIVYVVSKTGILTALTAADGRISWQANVEHGIYDPPAVADSRVVVNAGNGTRMMAVDAATGDRVSHWAAENVGSQPVVATGRLLYWGWNVSDIFVIG